VASFFYRSPNDRYQWDGNEQGSRAQNLTTKLAEYNRAKGVNQADQLVVWLRVFAFVLNLVLMWGLKKNWGLNRAIRDAQIHLSGVAPPLSWQDDPKKRF
jgi:hypothetical protein